LFDLTKDPHEVHNVADDPVYAEAKEELLAELDQWRKEVIHDQGVSDEFRAVYVFPASCPTPTVGEWAPQHADEYDYRKVGLPGWYPTRTLEEWKKVKKEWEPYVFREPDEKVARPKITYTTKPKVRRQANK